MRRRARQSPEWAPTPDEDGTGGIRVTSSGADMEAFAVCVAMRRIRSVVVACCHFMHNASDLRHGSCRSADSLRRRGAAEGELARRII